MLDYRLAPEARYPSAIEDALAAYCFLLGIHLDPSIGIKSRGSMPPFSKACQKVMIMGDSSGGCLALQLLHTLRTIGLPMPIGAVLMSPFVDNDLKSESWHLNWNSDFMSLDVHGIKWAISIYANGTPFEDSILSPINMDLTSFPPLLIQAGDSEVVLNDAERLHQRAAGYKVVSELQIFTDMFHVFQGMPN